MPLKIKLADRIQERINEKQQFVKKITDLQNEITKKDDRNAQLHKLFQGTAKIFSKQHNYVDQLKKQLESSKIATLNKEEALKIYRKMILELQENERELKTASKESEKERDQEIKDLKAKIKQLTEVKMAREKSEERLRKQSEEFLKVQQMNQVVYDILGEYSTQTGLLLRSQEVTQKLNNLQKELEKTKADLQKELSWWDKWIEDEEMDKRNLHKIENLTGNPLYDNALYFGQILGNREDAKIYFYRKIKDTNHQIALISNSGAYSVPEIFNEPSNFLIFKNLLRSLHNYYLLR